MTEFYNGLLWHLLVYYLMASLLSLVLYGFDKTSAEGGGWRVREDTLHLVDILGGWPGAYVAQQIFRHKTRKKAFRRTYWGTVLINSVILGWLLSPYGAEWAYRNFGGL